MNATVYAPHSRAVTFFGELSSIITNKNGRTAIAYRYPNCHPPEFPCIHSMTQIISTATQQRYFNILSRAPVRNAKSRNGLLISIELLNGFGIGKENVGRNSHKRRTISQNCRGM